MANVPSPSLVSQSSPPPTAPVPAPARHPHHGTGRAVLLPSGPTSAAFSELSYSYPLKLLSPRTAVEGPVATVYVLSYGGGLVSGDRIDLEVVVGEGCRLMMLTQGYTKVFRVRGTATEAPITRQRLHASIQANALLLLLPDPVTCFAHSSYSQIQSFDLHPTASAVILDWFTSGRMSRGEIWELERYRSVNDLRVAGRRVVKDVMLLHPSAPGELKARLAPYGCYATVFLFGPLVQPLLASLRERYAQIQQMQRNKPAEFVWSFSALDRGGGAGVLRCAGRETESVRIWLREALSGVRDVVGRDVYDKAFV